MLYSQAKWSSEQPEAPGDVTPVCASVQRDPYNVASRPIVAGSKYACDSLSRPVALLFMARSKPSSLTLLRADHLFRLLFWWPLVSCVRRTCREGGLEEQLAPSRVASLPCASALDEPFLSSMPACSTWLPLFCARSVVRAAAQRFIDAGCCAAARSRQEAHFSMYPPAHGCRVLAAICSASPGSGRSSSGRRDPLS
jgi:hypothetical protein